MFLLINYQCFLHAFLEHTQNSLEYLIQNMNHLVTQTYHCMLELIIYQWDLSIKTCDSEVLLLSEFINMISIFMIVLIWLCYCILIFLPDTKNKQFVSFNLINFQNYYLLWLVQELLVIFEAFFLEVNILSLIPSVIWFFASFFASDAIKE